MPGVPASAAAPFTYGAAPTPNVPAKAKRLHPLHTAEWLHHQVLDTGCYPDTERMTGRTTLLALSYICKALESPHEVIEVKDHHDLRHCHTQLVRTIHDMTSKLGLQGFLCNPSRLTIQFTNPIEKPSALTY